eukprot:Platyproteum_vivax@DN3779_c0_g1_i1.p1
MPHSFGYRARTRDKFSKAFGCQGNPSVSTYLRNFHQGEFVDLIVDPSVHKGMPHKYYHGRTARVFNITKRAVGVELRKIVGHREIMKRLHVRIEHVRKSRCQEEFKKRVKVTEELRKKAKADGVPFIRPKRLPKQPREGYFLETKEVTPLEPLHFVESYM